MQEKVNCISAKNLHKIRYEFATHNHFISMIENITATKAYANYIQKDITFKFITI